MVAYSFNKRFVAPIRSGDKRQTIRGIGRKRHAMPGEKLQLYAGMRTKHCEKIAEAVCESLMAVEIEPARNGALMIRLRGTWLYPDELDAFARADGFANSPDMQSFWLQNHGPETFRGLIILWCDMILL